MMPLALTYRERSFPVSAIYRFPDASHATPCAS